MVRRTRIAILGAAGRDFHDFLTFFKPRRDLQVVAFTAAQIPGIAGRRFPAELAGARYPDGIPIVDEAALDSLVRDQRVDVACLAYSDLSHQRVMEIASAVLAAGASFWLLGPNDTQVSSELPVVAVTAARTGAGKSQTARAIARVLRAHGRRAVAIRHSMPYGADLRLQAVQRFAVAEDFVRHATTIEEEEEYQPWLDHGFVVFAGFDYRRIVARAEREADVLVFDGGNNDVSMLRADLEVCVVDPHRIGDEETYYPGLVNLERAAVVVINKIDSAAPADVAALVRTVRRRAPRATIVKARSLLQISTPERIRGARCLAIGDGPTLTHGGMRFGAATLAIERNGGILVDPRPALRGSLRETYRRHPHLALELPAMGYGPRQVRDLERTVRGVDCDLIVDGSPADLQRIIAFDRPVVNVRYELDRRAERRLEAALTAAGILR